MPSRIDIHIAREKMQLKNQNACISFLNTVYKNEIIMCCFNNITHKVDSIFCTQDITKEDEEVINEIINDFLNITVLTKLK